MRRLRNTKTGVIANVDDDTAERLLAGEWVDAATPTTGYSAMKVADLRAEIERRNEGRDALDLLPVEGKKADLVATLEADDAAQ